ncbi:MAG TPA: right-handed parallel beta-helix repeat-containing protein [Oligoflexia bacterium]|nr:right-handed parallel beta-helix repeat-containing protein [Oligoflexia bacterium]HMP48789.1 right-handed parallel beta-helix repeat-containing protein [Oligoflexia bacterium]
MFRRSSYFSVFLLSLFLFFPIAIPDFDGLDSRNNNLESKTLKGLDLPAIGSWNGYLSHVVVLECMNQVGTSADIILRVKDQTNEVIGEEELSIEAFGSAHVILNKFGIKDKYGTFEINAIEDEDNLSLSCNTLTYRFNSEIEVEYVTNSALNSSLRGKSYGVYNSMNPDISVNTPIYNWLTIYNPGEIPFNGKVYVKDQGGNHIGLIEIDNIAPGGRQDYGLGHAWGQVVGTYEIAPDNPFLPYGAFLNRYSEVSHNKFNFSLHIPASKGKRNSGLIASSSMGPAWNWAEIANNSPDEVEAHLEVFNRFGDQVYQRQLVLAPYSQHHELLNTHIGQNNVGFFRVRSDKKVLVQSFYYGLIEENPGQISWAYNSAGGKGGFDHASLGVNTFLNAPNWLKLFVANDEAVTVKISAYDMSGSAVPLPNEGLVSVLGSSDIPLHEYLGYDFAGSIHLRTLGENLFQAEGVRVFMTKANTKPIPVIESMIAIVSPGYQVKKNADNIEDGDKDSGEDTDGENDGSLDPFGSKKQAIEYCMQELGHSESECESIFNTYCNTLLGDSEPGCYDESFNDDLVNDPLNNDSVDGPLPNGLRAKNIRVLSSTMHSISIEWDIEGDTNNNSSSKVKFRKKGATAWNEFMPLLRSNFTYLPELTQYTRPPQDRFNMFAGSLMFLTPGTEYEIWLKITDPDGGSAVRTITFSTKPFPEINQTCTYTVDSTETLSSSYANAQPGDVICLQSENYGDFRANKGGSNNNYIALVNAPGANPKFDRIRVDTSYLWIEGMTFETPSDTGAVIATSASPREYVVIKDNIFKGSRYSISMSGTSRYWYVADNYIEGDNPPVGTLAGEGVEFSRGSSGHTIAFNTITKVADGISYGQRNIDVFGNHIYETTDDGLEPDFGYANKRYWGNKIVDSYNYAISFQPMYSGPWYFIRNEIKQTAWTRQVRAPTSQGGTMFKFHGIIDRFVFLHNTFVHEAYSPIAQNRMRIILSSYSRNNLYVVPGAPVWNTTPWAATTAMTASSYYQNDWRTDVDFDGFAWNGNTAIVWDGTNYNTLDSFSNAIGIQENAIKITHDDFVNYPTDFRLKQNTPAVNSGDIVPGVNNNYLGVAPDRGAYEFGKPIPHYGAGTKETLRERHRYWEYW